MDRADEIKQFSKNLRSREGKQILRELNLMFNSPDLRGTDTHDTYYNLGKRDVVVYLNDLAEYSPEEDINV